ncbi:hypothetical protein GY45DRAFT_1017306 [Cubamyces sp. BRFM 1775]|nr:hypothetical protein GY45DRAFT_1017306 [Cubamyces sp. BRFM 1775]
MSISTCSFSRSTSWSSSSDVKYDSQAVKKGWQDELRGRVREYTGPIAEFIDKFLPCSTPCTLTNDVTRAFESYQPKPKTAGKRETDSYPDLLNGLEKIVEQFEADKRLTFKDTSAKDIFFPFDAFKDHHHYTAPDVSVSFPGKDIPSSTWQHISTVIEVKGDEKDDPFPRRGATHVRTVEQLAKSARNLLLAHGLLAAFVVGIYGDSIRLARFDHTCVIVSQPFYLSVNGAVVLRKFYWHFTHPLIGHPIAGVDPTVLPFGLEDQEWVKSELRKAKVKNWTQHIGELAKGRRVEVYDEKTGRAIPYLLYHVLDVNGRLFSRATAVWRVIEDTRIWKEGRLVPDPACKTLAKPRILKEAWRQVVRTAETKFYQRLDECISDEERHGLAKMVCGGDIGEFEMQWWKQTMERREQAVGMTSDATSGPSDPFHKTGPSDASLHPLNDSPDPIDDSPYPLFTSLGGRRDGGAQEDVRYTDFPLPYPQHQTYSWRVGDEDEEYYYLERSHMRIVIDDVGRCLTEFTSSREVVAAIRDAIIGHQRAWTRAQVMHRDVSLGNVLITDEESPERATSSGFLHDFDYSSMVESLRAAISQSRVDPASSNVGEGTEDAEDADAAVRRKERTGTFYYMAAELLNPKRQGIVHDVHHDLESFYWVLLWVVLRHTDCAQDHITGPQLCRSTFVFGDDQASYKAKRHWLLDNQETPILVRGNQPLTRLLADLSQLVFKQVLGGFFAQANTLTYNAVLAVFDAALAPSQDWPSNDWKECTLLDPDPRTVGPSIISERPAKGSVMVDPSLPSRGASGSSRSRNNRKQKAKPSQGKRQLAVRSAPVLGSTPTKRGFSAVDTSEPVAMEASGSSNRPRAGKRARTQATMAPPPAPQPRR